jgi:ferredoxin-nitrite reductase
MPIPSLFSLLPALHGEGVVSMSTTSFSPTCPGLFYGTSARDGILSRIRTPGGIITTQQIRVIADLADKYGTPYAKITNRANLQIRALKSLISSDILQILQEIGIASVNSKVDHLRNIMGSPTAGIDRNQLIDTRYLVREVDNYIVNHTELSELSAKFSISFDGGEAASIANRPNDVTFAAVKIDTKIYFRLRLNGVYVGILVKPEECVSVVGALAQVYLAQLHLAQLHLAQPHLAQPHLAQPYPDVVTLPQSSQESGENRKPRLKQILSQLGIEKFIEKVERLLPFSLTRETPELNLVKKYQINKSQEIKTEEECFNYQHIGVHPQLQQGLSYIGIVLTLGQLETHQIRGLVDIADTYGNSTLRLTPWQNLLVPNIIHEHIYDIKRKIEDLGLHWSPSNIRSALVSCTGNTGCSSSATDTKGHALALAKYLDKRIALKQPVNVHFTGCSKSCAQHHKSDITLLGSTIEQDGKMIEGYRVYVGKGCSEDKFGKLLYQWIPFEEIPPLIEKMLTSEF